MAQFAPNANLLFGMFVGRQGNTNIAIRGYQVF